MGLDMYLEVREYVKATDWKADGNSMERVPVAEGQTILKTAGLDKIVSKESYGVTVAATAIYWRKVNSIHKWFVDHCGDGRDECQQMYVSREKLLSLRDQVDLVLRSKNEAVAQEYLPTESGFFFGNTSYDEYYWSDLKYTLEELTRVLDSADEGVEFSYQASW